MTYQITKELPPLEQLLASPEIGFDTETHDPNLEKLGPGFPCNDGKLVGFSLAWRVDKKTESLYLPLFHEGGNNYHDPQQAVFWLTALLNRYRGTVLGANMLYDLGWIRTAGVHLGVGVIPRDVQWCAALLNENLTSYSLASLLKLHNLPPKDEILLEAAAKSRGLDPKKDLWRLPGNVVAPYADRDAASLLEIWDEQKTMLADQELEKPAKLEHDLLPVLLDMRFQGIRVDLEHAHNLKKIFREREEKIRLELKKLLGFEVEEWSANSVARAFDQQSIGYALTATGKPSFTADFLGGHHHPLAESVLKLRKITKATDTFVENMILGHARGARGDRIFSEFHPLRGDAGGARTTRFSSSKPNLQQVPERDPELGPLIRSAFLPNEGEEFGSADYSSQEPRLQVHYAILRKLTGWERLKQAYIDNPRTDFHGMVAEWTGLDRKIAKPFNLSLSYGGGLPTIKVQLARVFGREVGDEEARGYRTQYHERMPFIKELSDDLTRVVESRGYIKTLWGHRQRFPYWEPKNNKHGAQRAPALPWAAACAKWGEGNIKRAGLHKVLNKLIQPSAANQTKAAMIECHRQGFTPLIQVHDELCFSIGDRSAVPKIREIMENVVQLEVPSVVDFDLGPSWGAAKPFKED